MRSITLLFLLLTQSLIGQTTRWTHTIGNSNPDIFSDQAVDDNDNIFITGRFSGTAYFGPNQVGFPVTAGTTPSPYLLKKDAFNQVAWVRSFDWRIRIEHVDAGPAGGVFATGWFDGPADFDPGSGIFNMACTPGGRDGFILHLNAAGQFVSAKKLGGAGNEYAFVSKTQSNGNSIIAGTYSNTIDVDPGSGSTNLYTMGQPSVYISTLNAQLNYQWSTAYASAEPVTIADLHVSSQDDIITIGTHSGPTYFVPPPSNIVNVYSPNGYVVKHTSSGSIDWIAGFEAATGMVSTSAAYPKSVTTDSAGNIYITGSFRGVVDFDPSPSSTHYLTDVENTNDYLEDGFLVKLSSNGNFIWARHWASDYVIEMNDVALLENGHVVVVGDFWGNVFTDPSPGAQSWTTAAIDGVAIVLDSNGTYMYEARTHGPWNQYTKRAHPLNGDNFILSGSYLGNSTVSVSGQATTLATLGHSSDQSSYQWAIGNCALFQFTDTIKSCDPIVWRDGLSYNSSNYNASFVDTSGSCDTLYHLRLNIPLILDTITQSGNTLFVSPFQSQFAWMDCQTGQLIAGANDFSFQPTQDGQYAAIITNDGCTDTSDCYNFLFFHTEENAPGEVQLFPNPSQGQFHWKNTGGHKVESIYLFGLDGKNHPVQYRQSEEGYILTTQANRGVYVIQILCRDRLFIGEIVIQ